MRTAFHEELAQIEAVVVRTSGTVVMQLDKAMSALATFDTDLADEVIAADDSVDRDYMEVRSRVFGLMATQAPVASDLRLVAAMLHINIHLERMGDLCTTVAKVVKLACDLPRSITILERLAEMGAQAGRMTDCVIRSFSQRDLELASGLPRMDDPIDRLNRHIIQEVVAHGATDDDAFEWAMRMVLVSRQLERMGDHAVDIAEEVAFLITGEFREFTDASHKADGLGVGS